MPLPPPPADPADFSAVAEDVRTLLTSENVEIAPMDSTNSYGPLFVRLAWQCASTFRGTDFQVRISMDGFRIYFTVGVKKSS